MKLFLVAIALSMSLVLPAISTAQSARLVEFIGNGSASDGTPYRAELWVTNNVANGSEAYFALYVPHASRPPYSVVNLVEPYAIIPQDGRWVSLFYQGGPYQDISLPAEAHLKRCSTYNGVCNIPIRGVANLLDVSSVGDVLYDNAGGHTRAFSVGDMLVRAGYVVSVPFARFYLGNGILTVNHDVASVIQAIRGLPQVSYAMGVMGRSLGGQLAIHSQTIGTYHIPGLVTVAEAPAIDAPNLFRYYYDDLPRVQPPHLLNQSQDFSNPYYNRFARDLGFSPEGWWQLSNSYVASLFRSPLLLLTSSNDCMVPASVSRNLSRMLNPAQTVYWEYQHGNPPLHAYGAGACGHGSGDSGYALSRRILSMLFFWSHMPSNQPELVIRIPQDINLYQSYLELANVYINGSGEDRQHAEKLSLLFGNHRIRYVSSDPRVPSGNGQLVVQHLIQTVLNR